MKRDFKYLQGILLCLLISGLPGFTQIPTAGLVAFYPFNGNAYDESGNGNDGIIMGASLTKDRCLEDNRAFQFDGTSTYINVPDAPSLNPSAAITVCAWIKPISFTGHGNGAIVSKGYYSHSNPYYQYHLGLTGDSYVNTPSCFSFSASINNSYHVVTGDSLWYPEQWYFVVGSYDGQMLKLYVNTHEIANEIIPGYIDVYSEPISIARTKNFPGGLYTPGSVDDIRIYNRALTQQEIEILYYSNCFLGELTGPAVVCQNQKDVEYSIKDLGLPGTYSFTYSGQGVTIDVKYLKVSFGPNATSGVLTFKYTDTDGASQVANLYIRVNETPKAAGSILGPTLICVPATNLHYSTASIPGANSYQWKYTGTGVSMVVSSNSSNANFATNATPGSITVAGLSTCGPGPASQLLIHFNKAPGPVSEITGEHTICAGQNNIQYQVPPIDNADLYEWNFTGSGINFSADNNILKIQFLSDATDGILTVKGINICGQEIISSEFPITINHPPVQPSAISGPQEVCQNIGNVSYSTMPVDNTTSYSWTFSGENVAIKGTSEFASLYFFNNATSGNLSVNGVNFCGNGPISEILPIIVKSCEPIPAPLHIPNAFSPNGDGINDFFVIEGLPANSTLMIFDRSGSCIYKSDNYLNDWSGKDKDGNNLETGTYWYVLMLSDLPNEVKGFVYLKK